MCGGEGLSRPGRGVTLSHAQLPQLPQSRRRMAAVPATAVVSISDAAGVPLLIQERNVFTHAG